MQRTSTSRAVALVFDKWYHSDATDEGRFEFRSSFTQRCPSFDIWSWLLIVDLLLAHVYQRTNNEQLSCYLAILLS